MHDHSHVKSPIRQLSDRKWFSGAWNKLIRSEKVDHTNAIAHLK
jgi:hypothetical protein